MAEETNSANVTTDTAKPVQTLSDSGPNPPVKSKSKSKWLVPAVVVGVIALAGGGYAYMNVLQPSPEKLWQSSLKNTSENLTEFVNKKSSNKGFKMDGSVKVTEPTAGDATFTGSSYENSAKFNTTISMSGISAKIDLRTIPAANSKNPDIYLNVTGLKGLGGLLSAGAGADYSTILNEIDGKWYMVDHSLLDQATAKATQSSGSNTISQQDMQDIAKKVAGVMSDRMFSTDPAKAVLVIKEKLGKEDFKGRKTQHLKVQVQKQQFHDFAVAMKDALKDSKAKDLIMMGKSGTFEQAIDFDNMLKDIDGANYDKAVADVWVDTGLKYIRNVRIQDESTENGKMTADFMLDYKGGADLPMTISLNQTKGSDSMNGSLGLTMYKNRNQADMNMNLTGNTGPDKVAASGKMTFVGTDDKVDVQKPEGATNIMNFIGQIFGQIQASGGAAAGSTKPALDTTNILDDLQQ